MRRAIWIIVGIAILGISGVAVHDAQGQKKEDKKVNIQPGERVFELRTYWAHPGKMKDLEARFKDHTCKLFDKHGMTIIGFWKPLVPAKAEHEHKLIYLLAFPSREGAEKSWDAFRKDPDWIAVKKASEKDGSLTDKVESVFMKATDFSPMK